MSSKSFTALKVFMFSLINSWLRHCWSFSFEKHRVIRCANFIYERMVLNKYLMIFAPRRFLLYRHIWQSRKRRGFELHLIFFSPVCFSHPHKVCIVVLKLPLGGFHSKRYWHFATVYVRAYRQQQLLEKL